eukprot:TRINITY_DN1324_c0_g1_i1.p1 TRINITY_DN1324_c0_g1~~TRINITY_DN1324_c0_g1_i1.p1  ORF type:complete len:214 (-),score=23.64 TRINITY_DN1324_c0_g1_i1:415-1056(-)
MPRVEPLVLMASCAKQHSCSAAPIAMDHRSRRFHVWFDDYDVCQASARFANQRQGTPHEQRINDLVEEIRLKQNQASRLARRVRTAKATSTYSAFISHYERVSMELSAEVESLEAQLTVESGHGRDRGLQEMAESVVQMVSVDTRRAAGFGSPPHLRSRTVSPQRPLHARHGDRCQQKDASLFSCRDRVALRSWRWERLGQLVQTVCGLQARQ